MIKIFLNIILTIPFIKNNFCDKYFLIITHDNCIFEQFTLNLRFTTVMRNTLRRGREILDPRPTLGIVDIAI